MLPISPMLLGGMERSISSILAFLEIMGKYNQRLHGIELR